MGLERLLLVMEKQNCRFLSPKKCDIYFATMGDSAIEKAMELTKQLREYGFFAEYDLMGRGIKAQMKYANKTGSLFAIVLGDNELTEGKAKLRDMESGEETEILLDEKFVGNFDAVYFDKMMDSIENAEAVNAFQNLAEEKK